MSLSSILTDQVDEADPKMEPLVSSPPITVQQPLQPLANQMPALLTTEKTMKLSGTESDESESPTRPQSKPLPPGATICKFGGVVGGMDGGVAWGMDGAITGFFQHHLDLLNV